MTRARLEALALEARADVRAEGAGPALVRWAPLLLSAARAVDLSQRALGAMLGLRETHFSTLLRGREDLPPTLAELLPQVQAALGVPTLREAERAAAYVGALAILARSENVSPSP